MRMEEAFYNISMYLYNKNILEYAPIARSGPKSMIRDIEGLSTTYPSHCAMVHTQYTRPKCTHHPFTTSGLRTIEIEFQVRHFRRTFFPAFSFIVIPYLYQMYHRENTTELNTDVLIVVGFFLFPQKCPPLLPH